MDNLVEAGIPREAQGQAWKGSVLIFPGGGYQRHSDRESQPIANEYAKAGWKPWILYYKVSPEADETIGQLPLTQAAEAVKLVRSKLPGLPVVVCGFSSGGHAAANIGVHWNDDAIFPKEDQALIRPDAMILCYPVITAWEHAHEMSMVILAGSEPKKTEGNQAEWDAWHGRRDYYCLERHVTEQTPPTFLWHTVEDESVPVQNSIFFANSLLEKGVSFELHLYPKGAHGLSLATEEVNEPAKNRLADPHVAGWMQLSKEWLDTVNF